MTWDALAAVAPLSARAASPLAEGGSVFAPQRTPGAGFGELVSGAVDHVNQQLLTSQADLQHLAVGDVENLHQIMIRLEESRLSFQLMLQVRNRLLEAYQDVMKMQV